MANWSKGWSENLGRFPACNGSWGDSIVDFSFEGTLSFSRNTSDATKAWVHGPVYMRASGVRLGWATSSGNVRLSALCFDVDGSHIYDRWQGKGGQCHASFNYNYTHSDCWYALRSGTGLGRNYIGTHFVWGFTPTSSGADYQDIAMYDYFLPARLRITAPQGLSVSFPSSIDGTTSVSLSGWGEASNMTGTPTSYPKASYWNFALDLLDKSKNYLAHITKNTGERKYTNFYGFGYYTASALQYSSAANNSTITRKYNTKYYLRAYAQNSFNERVSTDSGVIYSPPKSPNVTINSILYQPATKDCIMNFSWSKPTDESDYQETVSYRVISSDGTVIKAWTSLGTTYGGALSGDVTVDNLKSGEVYTVEVRVKSTAGTSTDSDSYVAPVANAAFLGFDWDELRRTITVRAEAPGAANCRIQAGDQPNNYNLGDKLTSGEVGTITLKDLPHGDGQALYLQAIPEASNGYQYTNEIAKVTVPVPNPILGVLTPPCDSGGEQRYIVDMVEKKADCSVTPKWQVGDRVAMKKPCSGGGIALWGAANSSWCKVMTLSHYIYGCRNYIRNKATLIEDGVVVDVATNTASTATCLGDWVPPTKRCFFSNDQAAFYLTRKNVYVSNRCPRGAFVAYDDNFYMKADRPFLVTVEVIDTVTGLPVAPDKPGTVARFRQHRGVIGLHTGLESFSKKLFDVPLNTPTQIVPTIDITEGAVFISGSATASYQSPSGIIGFPCDQVKINISIMPLD